MQAASFLSFVGSLGIVLTSEQTVLCAVVFDGVEPGAFTGEHRIIARKLFGNVDTVPALARAVVVAVCGRRGGKSYILCALRALHLALTVPLDTLAPGETAFAVIVAPDTRLARQTLRFVVGAARNSSAIAKRIEAETADSLTLRRENGRSVTVEVLPASSGGSAVRGRSLVCFILDETAFFRDKASAVNDEDVFKAGSPCVVPGGQTIVASTPWAESGLLHELFLTNFGKPTTAIACHAPTLLLRRDEKTRAMVERERQRDPDNCLREFDAEFMPSGSGVFFDSAAIDACVDKARPLSLEPSNIGRVGCGADFGFSSDSSALAVVNRDAARYTLRHLEELRPAKGAPLQPSVTVERFADVSKKHGRASVMADGHYKESVREHLSTHGLHLEPAPEGQHGKADSYLHLRKLINEQRIELPNHPRLIRQLKDIVSKPTPGGGMQISAPRRAGAGHGDLVSALVLACWTLRGGDTGRIFTHKSERSNRGSMQRR